MWNSKVARKTSNFGDPGMYIYICRGSHLDTYFVAIYLRKSQQQQQQQQQP